MSENHPPETDRAVAYRRLSQGGKSLPEQLDAIERYCSDLELDLVEEYSDGTHASGYTADRGEYQAMLERLEAGDVGHVVVRDRARLSRDSLHRIELLIQLHRQDVTVHAAEPGEVINLEDAYALTRESAQADADDVEKRKEAERGAAEADRRRELELPNGRAPYGLAYSEDGERLVPGEQYQEALEVIRLREEEWLSWRRIAGETDVNKDTARRLYERREEYRSASRA